MPFVPRNLASRHSAKFGLAENANVPIAIMLRDFSSRPSSRARYDARGISGRIKTTTSTNSYRSAGCAHACLLRRRSHWSRQH